MRNPTTAVLERRVQQPQDQGEAESRAETQVVRRVLLSIHPRHAQAILDGRKRFEFRRVCPKVGDGDEVYFYATRPKQAIVGRGVVARVVVGAPSRLWEIIGPQDAGLTRREFDDYFAGIRVGAAIRLRDAAALRTPLQLTRIQSLWTGFKAPQSYRYMSESFGSLLQDVMDE